LLTEQVGLFEEGLGIGPDLVNQRLGPGLKLQRINRGGDILRSDRYYHMFGADFIERFTDDKPRQFGPIAVSAEVPQIELLQVARYNFLNRESRGVIGKMSMPAEDSLFDAPGASQVILEHLHVMVRFQHQDVGGPNSLNDKLGGVAQVGEKANIPAGRSEQETDRVVGIVGNTESINLDIAGLECGAGGKEMEVQLDAELKLNGFFGQPITKDRHANFAGQCCQTLDMIGMLVSDEDPGEIFDRSADRQESFANLAAA